MTLVQNELKNAYIGIPYPESISLNRNSISLTTIWQTEQLTATILPTVSDKTITWASSDNTIATVSSSWLVTCVTPWECTITATTVNNLTATCSVGQWRLPSTYQEVEYIESSWTQKINTWYTTNSNMRIVCDFYTTNTAINNVIFATENWSWAWSNYILCFTNNTDFLIGTNSGTTFTGTPLSTKHKVEFSLSSITLDSTTITKSSSVGTYNISLFQWNGNSGKVRIYSFKAYTWATQERDLVPCYRIGDSVIWMYDLVNWVFYTNAGSWTFTKWADV